MTTPIVAPPGHGDEPAPLVAGPSKWVTLSVIEPWVDTTTVNFKCTTDQEIALHYRAWLEDDPSVVIVDTEGGPSNFHSQYLEHAPLGPVAGKAIGFEISAADPDVLPYLRPYTGSMRSPGARLAAGQTLPVRWNEFRWSNYRWAQYNPNMTRLGEP